MNVYLVASESYKLLKEEINKIIGDSLNVVKFDARLNTINEVIAEAGYYSLMGDKKYIIYKEPIFFKASKGEEDTKSNTKDIDMVLDYLKNPNKDTTLIFAISYLPDKRKKILKEIEKVGKVVVVPTLNKKELVYKCMEILQKKKYTIDYETANYIVENSYVNYDIMTSELEKVYALIKPGKITIDDLKNVISLSITDNVFAFINAIINQDLEKSFKYMSNFEQLKIDPNMVLIMLFKEYEILYLILNGHNPSDIQKLYGKQDWQMQNYLLNASKYKINEIKKIIMLLGDYDYKLKSGLLDRSVALSLLTLELCE